MDIIYNCTQDDISHANINYSKWNHNDFHDCGAEAISKFVKKNSLLSDNIKNYLKKTSKSPFPEYLYIKGMDLDFPESGFEKSNYKSELFLASLAYYLGYPVSNINHKNGRIVHDIYPIAEDKKKQIGSNAEQFLFWHTENAHENPLPSYIALFCLRGDLNAETFMANLHIAPISKEEREILGKEIYIISSDLSHIEKNETCCSIYSEKNGYPCYRFGPLYTKVENEDAVKILNNLISYCDDNKYGIILEKGDLLLINNRICCHARSIFKSNYDGNDRWIQRVIINS